MKLIFNTILWPIVRLGTNNGCELMFSWNIWNFSIPRKLARKFKKREWKFFELLFQIVGIKEFAAFQQIHSFWSVPLRVQPHSNKFSWKSHSYFSGFSQLFQLEMDSRRTMVGFLLADARLRAIWHSFFSQQNQKGGANDAGSENKAQHWPEWWPNCGPFPCPPARPNQQQNRNMTAGRTANSQENERFSRKPVDGGQPSYNYDHDFVEPQRFSGPASQTAPTDCFYGNCTGDPDPTIWNRQAGGVAQNAAVDCDFGFCNGDPNPNAWQRAAGVTSHGLGFDPRKCNLGLHGVNRDPNLRHQWTLHEETKIWSKIIVCKKQKLIEQLDLK